MLLGNDPLLAAIVMFGGVQYGHKSNKSPAQRRMLSCQLQFCCTIDLLSFVYNFPNLGISVRVAGSDRLQPRWNPAMLKYLYADNDVQRQGKV